MGYCPNCKAHLTCGCQKRVSKNNVAGCSNCITALNTQQVLQPSVTQPISGTAPSGVQAGYSGPGEQI
jgi:hypothetical protein